MIDYYKQNRVDSLEEMISEPESGDGLYENLDKKQQTERLMSALTNATPEQKEVLLLKYIEELPNSEIATVTQKSEEAIRALQSRGLATLRKILKP